MEVSERSNNEIFTDKTDNECKSIIMDVKKKIVDNKDINA